MSRAFEGLGFIAAIVFVLIVIAGAIRGGAKGLADFIEKYYIILGIVLLVVIASICFCIFKLISEKLSFANRIINCLASGLALAQNAGFLVYGLYRALTVYSNDAFLIVLALGGFVLVYIIDTVITVAGISLSKDKPWSPLVTVAIAGLGLLLIVEW